MTAEKITVEALVNVPLDTAWSCWTEPDHITKWNFDSDDWCCPHASSDLKVGGQYVARMEAKDGSIGFDFEGMFGEVENLSAITLKMGDGREARTTFEAVDQGTKITTVFDAEQENTIELQRGGWQAILDNYKKHAESV